MNQASGFPYFAYLGRHQRSFPALERCFERWKVRADEQDVGAYNKLS
jgi:hypothetical protein